MKSHPLPSAMRILLTTVCVTLSLVGCGTHHGMVSVQAPPTPSHPSHKPPKVPSPGTEGQSSKGHVGSQSTVSGVTPSPHAHASSPTNASQPVTTQMPDATAPFETMTQANTGSNGQSGASADHSQGPSDVGTELKQVIDKAHLKPSEQQIVAPYVTRLTGLQSTYEGTLSALYQQAKTEFHAGSESKATIEKKYIPKVLNLENSAQDQLNSLLFSLKDKLQTAGFATTPVDNLRNEYYAEVTKLQAQLGG